MGGGYTHRRSGSLLVVVLFGISDKKDGPITCLQDSVIKKIDWQIDRFCTIKAQRAAQLLNFRQKCQHFYDPKTQHTVQQFTTLQYQINL